MTSSFIGNPSGALKSFIFHRHQYNAQDLYISYIDREINLSPDHAFLSGQIELTCDGYDDVTVNTVKLILIGKDEKNIGAIDLISHFEDSPEQLVIKGFRNMRLPFKVGIKRELWEKSDGIRAMYKSEDIKGKSRLYRKKDFHASET